MPAASLLQEDADREASLVKFMHGNSAEQRNSFMSMLKKDGQAHRLVTDEYLRHWDTENTEDAREGRKAKYMSLVNKLGFAIPSSFLLSNTSLSTDE